LSKSLVIVESPAKARTVNQYLGKDYVVKASMGHVRDLPKKELGVDIEKDFLPTYQIIPEKKKIVAELKAAARASKEIILAADPDREGEAICWHLSQVMQEENPNISRAVFHEITSEAILEAFRKTAGLDQNLIDAQQTRRILDRLAGYLISPLLWKKVGKGLSAGRVQSVALRLICDREKEIQAFVSEEYWTITAVLEAGEAPVFKASLVKIDGKKARIQDEAQARGVVEECGRAPFILEKITVKEKKRVPPPPFITSTLQQDAFRLLKYPVKRTMGLAQRLYEGVALGPEIGQTGLITYMRTDSVRISEQAAEAARRYVEEKFGRAYIPAKPHAYKSSKKAQEAHEAIRPARLDLPPETVAPFLKKEEMALYRLIWNRFLASQMAQALIEETGFDIRSSRFLFKAKGEVVKFDGFLVLYPNGDKDDEEKLPRAHEGEALKLLSLEPKQNFTQPPPRYTEGTLVKELESRGIGRPSTYAPIIATIQDRTYVTKDKGRFKPTALGLYVTDFLVKHFTTLLEYEFTARMEEELDEISEGLRNGKESLRVFYALLEKDLHQGQKTESIKKTGIPIDEKCPKCGSPLVIKSGRFGRFKSCSRYPECDYRESMVKKEAKVLEEKCPLCGAPLVQRFGRYGPFIACSNYPGCKYVKKENAETGIACPRPGCGGMLVRRKTKRGRIFFGCSNYPKCDFASWEEPVKKTCPKCGAAVLFRKRTKEGSYLYCRADGCDYREPAETEEQAGKSAGEARPEKDGQGDQ